MIVKLFPGSVHVGMYLPRFIPEAMIEAKLSKLGLSNFRWADREKDVLTVNPRQDPLYTDDWNRTLVADYRGTPTEFEEKKIWSWLIVVPRMTP